MHISNANNKVHELAPPTCVLLLSKNIDPPQYCSSWSMSWICTYQMQTTKFMSLLPLLVCSSFPRILILLNIAPLDPCPWSHSHLPLCHPRIIHIFVHFSPPLSSMTIKRAETTWNLPCEDQWLPLEVVPLVLVGLPLEYPL